ncbi:MAG: hypothetical protein A2Z83_08850 [Omnitrophica bacterium GWA2_52_8]|nr:MAG: hypothetical protein A2Z83_08850 [Omnitrophica bacterium GWA2_52_8]
MNNMLTLEETKRFLDIEQQALEKYIQYGKLRAYKIGGTYIRFRKEEVLNLRYEIVPSKSKKSSQTTIFSRLYDFWRFNNFYIISLAVVIVLTVVVFKF